MVEGISDGGRGPAMNWSASASGSVAQADPPAHMSSSSNQSSLGVSAATLASATTSTDSVERM